jgi:hypothetical protein
MNTAELIGDMCRLVQTAHPKALKRVRFAVTLEEMEAIQKSFTERDGVFYFRIMNVPLVVENDPENPILVMR